jgi:hypothetical protein
MITFLISVSYNDLTQCVDLRHGSLGSASIGTRGGVETRLDRGDRAR